MKVSELNRDTLRIIKDRAIASLAPIAKELGVQFKFAGGRFEATNAILKLEVMTVGTNGKAFDRERDEYLRHCNLYELDKSWLDKTFLDRGYDKFKIVGLNMRRRKNPVICENLETRKRFVFPAAAIRHAMEAK